MPWRRPDPSLLDPPAAGAADDLRALVRCMVSMGVGLRGVSGGVCGVVCVCERE